MYIFLVMILLSTVSCQQNDTANSTSVPFTPTSAASLEMVPTRQPRDVAARPEAPTDTPPPLVTIPPTPYIEPTLPPDARIVGQSAEGRSIVAREMGTGRRKLLLVGGMHGGWEANTVALINELIAHFEANPADIPPGTGLIFVPAANPDGLLRGRTPEGRFNSSGVDLNRNWGCNWQAEAYWRDQTVSAGERAFSEPESAALRDFILQTVPATVLFYHSAAAGVFAGTCGGDAGSMLMAQLYGQAAGYTYGQSFSAYPVTGTAATWVNSMGIASADVELQTQTDSEFARNLAGVRAILAWLADES